MSIGERQEAAPGYLPQRFIDYTSAAIDATQECDMQELENFDMIELLTSMKIIS